ncbi:MAG TPA: malectin domain-containing carbohydrate-binding protein [Candidatus Hydrogenedentes bacterium]|nr:malectin domain-containing carbohydrate-binding protein [Candidatus Hydrogenedentota bacterium]HOL75884.1 malectin domain-containing carbohydrate-binding protein [Candidatus Hydrogenedentota bacterium]HPO85707.1 malectin domain-containing carbohydrate-binding protein [Candidatus Hydrogenedentota bacterium]
MFLNLTSQQYGLVAFGLFALFFLYSSSAWTATRQSHYYAHDTVEDERGIIAPWYQGLNGQWDFRVRIAAETLKRYPWTAPDKAPTPAPEYMYNGAWDIDSDGTITVKDIDDWANGDLGQRAAYVLSGWVDYYRYTGDPCALAHVTLQANLLLDYCQTDENHEWPRFLISVPLRGKAYAQADPHGLIQLDITAEVGLALLRAYQLVGEKRWLDAACHWGELLAAKCDLTPGLPPWGRYANPENAQWEDHMTGGVVFILAFFDELIALGYTGEKNEIPKARTAGIAYLSDYLLPRWFVNDTWGRNYWDWPCGTQTENVTEFAARYLIEHPEEFPNWQTDARNILSIFLTRTSVCPNSGGDVYSGAWAYPESYGCCGRSLWYGPLELAPVWAQLGVVSPDNWALEIARRKAILATYDAHENGVVEDGIDGGPVVAGDWFKIAHPMALKHVLNAIGWMPEFCGANRENHIIRTDSVVSHVVYATDKVEYETFDGRPGARDVLRLNFEPSCVLADDVPLPRVSSLESNGVLVHPLCNGDCIVTIRHDGARRIVVQGKSPQQKLESSELTFSNNWISLEDGLYYSETPNAFIEGHFKGNQFRIIGKAAPDGGIADIYIDGKKQIVALDCWIPTNARDKQVLYYINGLEPTEHSFRLIARGESNPHSIGKRVYVREFITCDATGTVPMKPIELRHVQRMVFGRTDCKDYIDTFGNRWKPATEIVTRLGREIDVVKNCWLTERQRFAIANTSDPDLYRYGHHAPCFWVNLTVGSGPHYVRLKFAETRTCEPALRTVCISINGENKVTDMDILATAGGLARAADIVFNGIQPKNGVIEVRLWNQHGGEAVLQALECGPGEGGNGVEPVCWQPTS